MHKFWIFPLVLGFVGVAYPVICVAEGWNAYAVFVGITSPVEVWAFWLRRGGRLDYSVGVMFSMGATIGLGAALVEMTRRGRSDRSDIKAAWRLVGNGMWLGGYALLVNASLTLLLTGMFRIAFLGPSSLRDSVPFIFILSFSAVNAGAVLWATIRTAFADDVLSPRVLRAKWRSSNRAIE